MAATLMTLGEILDATIEHIREWRHDLLGVVAWLLVAAMPVVVAKLLQSFLDPAVATPLASVVVVLQLLGMFTIFLASVWIVPSLLLMTAQQMRGKRMAPIDAMRNGWAFFFPSLVVSILTGLRLLVFLLPLVCGVTLLTASSVALIPEGFWTTPLLILGSMLMLGGIGVAVWGVLHVTITWAFSPYLVALAGARGMAALRQSAALVKGLFVAIAVRIAVPALLFSIGAYLLNLGMYYLLLGAAAVGVPLAGPLVVGLGSAAWFLWKIAIGGILTLFILVTNFSIFASLQGYGTRNNSRA